MSRANAFFRCGTVPAQYLLIRNKCFMNEYFKEQKSHMKVVPSGVACISSWMRSSFLWMSLGLCGLNLA